MTLPVNDISPEARRLVVSTLSDPRALTEVAEVTWRSGESWRPIARSSIKFFMATSQGNEAAGLSAMGSALMRRYHLVYLADQQGSVEQNSPLEL